MDKGPDQTLLQGGQMDGPKTYERMPISLASKEMQMKTTVRDHFTLARMANINQQTSAGEDVQKMEPYCTVGGNADWCSHCAEQYGISSKN